ncbi:hypothetical protein ABAC460_18065 [Asticcacaulis sp. AC460]|uniref:tannase/feruloyl esterase family alpha/beta hydrolase n=1 Tax=Asticcacaulis sp. AC460 TaxID=1282360 RepID=UPI0003C3EC1D|nr:tannase/feruloyl esterase family alpha/beta hydrolase [Asticcacaulis sp. AC460]ESQ87834.1 hypothetical protein ABAC460_18065 [Asticcacaulis sp. AC460]
MIQFYRYIPLIALGFATSLAFATASKAETVSSAACDGFAAQSVPFKDKSVRLTSSVSVTDGTSLNVMAAPGMTVPVTLPAHCEVTGILQERKGVDGQAYAIRFHLRLPVNWNHRFAFQGGSGSNGDVGNALGMLPGGQTALAMGYAVVSQDSGHDNATNSNPLKNGQTAFGFDPQARQDYGRASLKLVADTAKEAITAFYGAPIQYSYFLGCSKGGQEGMAFAQYYPDEFDGIVAGAPGFSLPRAAVAEAWDVQKFGSLVKQPGTKSFSFMSLSGAFSSSDLALVRTTILAACDDKDGLADGIVSDYLACTDIDVLPRLQALTCVQGKTAECLSAAQIEALTQSHNGPKDRSGHALYSSWFWPSGIAGEGWRLWKIGMSNGQVPALNLILGGPALASVFTTPPTALGPNPQATADYLARFDFDTDAQKIYAVVAPYTHSAWDDISARSTDLSAFHERGGKLIVPHGESDPVFSLKDTLAWYDEVDTLNQGKASSFVRVFPVPGLCHCGGGQATDTYDAFGTLIAWVERGIAPDYLVGTASPEMPWPGRQRPICAYPKISRYDGKGDPEKLTSFVCTH